MIRIEWTIEEEKILRKNYNIKTIKELKELLPRRNSDSINAKIKRLKAAGKLSKGKTKEAIARAYAQR